MLFYSIYFLFDLLLSELTFRISAYQTLNLTIWILLFSISWALIIAAFVSLFKTKVSEVLAAIASIAIFLIYGVNLVYQHIFTTVLSVTQIGMGGAAIKSFFRETLIGIKESALYALILLVPIIVLFLSYKFGLDMNKRNAKKKISGIVLAILFTFGLAVLVNNQPDASYGPKELYNKDFVLSLSNQKFGCLTSLRLEIRNLLLGNNSAEIELDAEEVEEHVAEYDPEQYNALDIDFDELARSTQDVKLQTLDAYFAQQHPSMKNEYTGKYEGYNLITILCESFSPYLIDKDRTPTLYKLAHEGIQFNDYYSCNDNNTSNSEYCFLTSLLPDETLFAPTGSEFAHFREYNSCTASQNNYEPMSLANNLNKRGYRTIFYHNYLSSYYNRDLTHGNFGFKEMCTMNDGLSYSPYWPTSDIELMNQAMGHLLKPDASGNIKNFYAYFLSFSGHMAYNFETNQMAINHMDLVEELEYSDEVKAYISCNYELEEALNYMISELDKAGVLDNTLIVLAPDHYPYGLGIGTLSELADRYLAPNRDEMERNTHKGCLLMWTPSMKDEEKVVIDYPVSELDILPTLLNLFGIEFDSRLLMGTDAFSNSRHCAIFDDRSFVTQDFYFNINTGNAVARSDKEVSDSILEWYIKMIKNKFSVSNTILYSDYYRHVFGK